MRKLTKSQYYSWYDRSSKTSPYHRYLNREFMLAEEQRIQKTKEWFKEYRDAEEGEKLGEVKYYQLPIKITKGWSENIAQRGEYNVRGLSALRNCIQNPLVGLYPRDIDLPLDYSLIRIISSEKVVLTNDKVPRGQYALQINEIEPLPADHLYVDVPFEKNSVNKVLYESLNHDEFTANALESPLLSSPIASQGYGGVGMTSTMSNTPFVQELFRQLQIMMPPEYRSVPAPKTDRKGKWKSLGNGRKQKIRFNVAERHVDPQSDISLARGSSYDVINTEINRRLKADGEYSFVGSLVPKGGNTQIFNEVLGKFTQTEITTFHLHQMREADVNLQNLRRNIGDYEELYLSMVHARQLQPAIDQSKLKLDSWKDDLRKEWDAYLPQMGHEEDLHFVKDMMAEQSLENLKNLAQSRTRARGGKKVKKKDMKEAFSMFNRSVDELVNHDITQNARDQIRSRTKNEKHQTLHTILNIGRYTTDEIWEQVEAQGIFKNKNKLQAYLDWLDSEDYIIRGPYRRYRWL